jgi:type VI secretion system protein ImpB
MLSVPKSRVNIKYVKHIGNATEQRELPNRMLVLGDFTLKEPDPDKTLADREKLEINRKNFNDVMKNQKLNLDLTVPDRLSSKAGGDMKVNLRIDGLDSFRPEAIVPQVDELKKIQELRNLLLNLKSQVVSRRQFRRELERIVQGDLDTVMKEFASLGYLPDESKEEEEK